MSYTIMSLDFVRKLPFSYFHLVLWMYSFHLMLDAKNTNLNVIKNINMCSNQ